MAEVLSTADIREESCYTGEINPAFSFPMGFPTQSAKSAPLLSMRSRPADISTQPASPFLFPPPSTPPLQASVPPSPTRLRTAGHRRGPSEFIGGDASQLGPGLMSTSPTKGENALPTPNTSGRRRGHAHRRSAAISQHDLSNIIKNPEQVSRRTGSAPATPSDPDMQFARPTIDRASTHPYLPHNNVHGDPVSPDSPTESSPPSAARPRVGFSDKLEYIPRPLSIISSATSSSVSTIRPSHSMNDSITSLRSFGTSSPPSARKDSLGDDVFGGELHADTERSPVRDNESPSGRGKGKARRYSPPPSLSEECMASPEEAVLEDVVPQVSRLQVDLSRLRGVPDMAIRPKSSPTDLSDNKASKRGKSWSDLLIRKGKPEIDESVSPQQPQFNTNASLESDFDLDDINFDEDSTYTVRSPEFDIPRSVASNPSPSTATFDLDTDTGAVLDLDEVWNRAGSTSEGARNRQSKRAMHSSGVIGSFAGPGMHYHRRAESAPVMPPVDYALGFPRYGSNPQMADVFEEEEDDYNQNSLSRQASRQNKAAKERTVQAMDINTEEAEPEKVMVQPVPEAPIRTVPDVTRVANFSLPSPPLDRVTRKGQDLPNPIVVHEHKAGYLADSAVLSTRSYATSSHSSYPSQTDHVSTVYSSTEASPLQTSFDVPRLGTAHSSATDKSAWSSGRIGENMHPHTMSLDDVPSLVSSSSTMISHMPNTPTIGTHMLGERAHSVSAETTVRPRTPLQAAKRASLASLSKLMSGSFSEKSKLSIESKAEYEEEEDTTKTKKRNRISRLMRMKFWKSKEDIRGSVLRDEPKTA